MTCSFGTMDWFCCLPEGHEGSHSSGPKQEQDDLSDDALRERAQAYVHRNGGIVETLWAEYKALRDAARADADREATKRMQIGSNIVLDAYKKHHEHFHSECSITGPGRLPDTGRTVK